AAEPLGRPQRRRARLPVGDRDRRVALRAHQADPAELRRADDAQGGPRGPRTAAYERIDGVAGRGAAARRAAPEPARRLSGGLESLSIAILRGGATVPSTQGSAGQLAGTDPLKPTNF